MDIFVKGEFNTMLENAKSFDIAISYFQVYGGESFVEFVEELLKIGSKIRLLIGDGSKSTY